MLYLGAFLLSLQFWSSDCLLQRLKMVRTGLKFELLWPLLLTYMKLELVVCPLFFALKIKFKYSDYLIGC